MFPVNQSNQLCLKGNSFSALVCLCVYTSNLTLDTAVDTTNNKLQLRPHGHGNLSLIKAIFGGEDSLFRKSSQQIEFVA